MKIEFRETVLPLISRSYSWARRESLRSRKRSGNDKIGYGDQHARQASSCQILRFSARREATGANTQRLWRSVCLSLAFSPMHSTTRAENVSNFIEADSFFGPDTRLVYKHFATLYFVFIFDSSENELAMLDLIQVFVETLDKCFKNVCELDIVFNYSKLHTILDEIIFGGQVLETSSTEVIKAVEEISKLESASNTIALVSKSVSGWRSR